MKDIDPAIDDVTYTVVDKATNRGQAMFIDSQGYTYNVYKRHLSATDWQSAREMTHAEQ